MGANVLFRRHVSLSWTMYEDQHNHFVHNTSIGSTQHLVGLVPVLDDFFCARSGQLRIEIWFNGSHVFCSVFRNPPGPILTEWHNGLTNGLLSLLMMYEPRAKKRDPPPCHGPLWVLAPFRIYLTNSSRKSALRKLIILFPLCFALFHFSFIFLLNRFLFFLFCLF